MNVAITPKAYKDIDPEETFAPYQIDLRNGHLSDAGNWIKRPGYVEKWDTLIESPVSLLIPVDTGYAVTKDMNIVKLGDTISSLSIASELNIRSWDGIPTYDEFDNSVYICSGGNKILKINKTEAVEVNDTLIGAKYISRLSGYTIFSGHDDTEFKWSASGNPENITTGDSGFANVKKTGEKIRYQITHKEKLFFFKDESIEVWVNLGGTTPFVRQTGAWIEKGCGSSYSVVEANDTLYWWGNDGDFYVLDRGRPKVISKSFRSYLDTLVRTDDIYGFDCRRERVIRWFAPTDGRCFVYDYVKGLFSEDNIWKGSGWGRLPFYSYMEMGDKQYFGSYNYDGKVYDWSKDFKDDNGVPIRVYRKLAFLLNNNGHNSRVNQLGFRVKRGVATDSTTTPNMFYNYRFDKGLWRGNKDLDLGVKGDRNPWIFEKNLGIGRELEIEVVETDAVDYILTHMNITSKELGR